MYPDRGFDLSVLDASKQIVGPAIHLRSVPVIAGQTLQGMSDIGLLVTTRVGRLVYVKDVAEIVVGASEPGKRSWTMTKERDSELLKRPAAVEFFPRDLPASVILGGSDVSNGGALRMVPARAAEIKKARGIARVRGVEICRRSRAWLGGRHERDNL